MPSVQAVVYEEFARNIPGFKHLTENEAATIAPKVRALVGGYKSLYFHEMKMIC